MPARGSAFVVILHGPRVLLVQSREGRRWQLPGGRIEKHETAWGAARREVAEETGLHVRIVSLTGVYSRRKGPVYVFGGRVARPDLLSGPNREIRRQRWMSALQALRLLPKGARRRLREALRRPSNFRARPGFVRRLPPLLAKLGTA